MRANDVFDFIFLEAFVIETSIILKQHIIINFINTKK